ncbi:MAG: hypothetical protein POG74_07870 [Acidocella sp.]|nr:hypothetical protein [Acidocella sp.]
MDDPQQIIGLAGQQVTFLHLRNQFDPRLEPVKLLAILAVKRDEYIGRAWEARLQSIIKGEPPEKQGDSLSKSAS